MVCFPFGFCILLFGFFLVKKFRKKTKFSAMLEDFLITGAIILFYFQAPVINGLAGMLNCSHLDHESYMTDYPLEACSNNARYYDWNIQLILPAACFFVLIFPICLIYYLHKNRDIVFSKVVIYKVGFLMNGYSSDHYYW